MQPSPGYRSELAAVKGKIKNVGLEMVQLPCEAKTHGRQITQKLTLPLFKKYESNNSFAYLIGL